MRQKKVYGKALREMREAKGLTQANVSRRLGVHPQYVSNVERGVCFYSREHVPVLGKAFGVAPVEIYVLEYCDKAMALRNSFIKLVKGNPLPAIK